MQYQREHLLNFSIFSSPGSLLSGFLRLLIKNQILYIFLIVSSTFLSPCGSRAEKRVLSQSTNIQATTIENNTKTANTPMKPPPEKKIKKLNLTEYCQQKLKTFPGEKVKNEDLEKVCSQVKVLNSCFSNNGHPIFHFENSSENSNKEKRILVLSLIHGDEAPSGTVARSWIQRLTTIDSRNKWRVLPLVNPDGYDLKTRMNVHGVDLNRNFPTKDWTQKALSYWKTRRKSDPRNFPGPSPASELETQCLVDHIKDFHPDFIISIHTPYGVLDFDGPPRLSFPKFSPLPWISLGNYPGSLGRYMWVDHKVPVLTIELKGNNGLSSLEKFDRLQDISGTVAIQADKVLKKASEKK